MSVLATALTYQRLTREHAALRMLRSENLPLAAAVLGGYFAGPTARMPADELHAQLDGELDALRDHLGLSQRTAKAYCDDWRSSGILIRRPADQSRGETYELSSEARQAIRILEQMAVPRTTLTESRLVSLTRALRQLAIDTDPDAARRLAALEAQRTEIDAEIERIRGGDVTVLDERRALERVEDVLQQAHDLPADFARVRARFEELNHDLRARILDSDEVQSRVLDDIFRGVNLIEESEAGRTFSAFAALLRDPQRSATLDSDVREVLDRDFARGLSPESRRTLHRLGRTLKEGSHEVHTVLTEFARGLRRYVQSREFQRDRVLRSALQQALAAALPAAQSARGTLDLDRDLALTSVRMTSLGELLPRDPAEYDAGAPLADAVVESIDRAQLATLARESEIDFGELIGNVNASVDEAGPVSVGEVLRRRPATQGLASVIGLLSLAVRHGELRAGESESVVWVGVDEVERAADVACHVFVGRIEE